MKKLALFVLLMASVASMLATYVVKSNEIKVGLIVISAICLFVAYVINRKWRLF